MKVSGIQFIVSVTLIFVFANAVADEGEVLPAYIALSEITTACVTCHASFRIK